MQETSLQSNKSTPGHILLSLVTLSVSHAEPLSDAYINTPILVVKGWQGNKDKNENTY